MSMLHLVVLSIFVRNNTYNTIQQYNFIAKCQYTDCTRNVLCVCVGGGGEAHIASVCIDRISCRIVLSGDEESAGNHGCCCCLLVVFQRGCLNLTSARTARRALFLL